MNDQQTLRYIVERMLEDVGPIVLDETNLPDPDAVSILTNWYVPEVRRVAQEIRNLVHSIDTHASLLTECYDDLRKIAAEVEDD